MAVSPKADYCRPEPDRTGAIQHSMAALRVCRSRPDQLPEFEPGPNYQWPLPYLGDAVHKLWGYASQKGRHVQEGHDASAAEAELVLSVACSLAVFLLRRD